MGVGVRRVASGLLAFDRVLDPLFGLRVLCSLTGFLVSLGVLLVSFLSGVGVVLVWIVFVRPVDPPPPRWSRISSSLTESIAVRGSG